MHLFDSDKPPPNRPEGLSRPESLKNIVAVNARPAIDTYQTAVFTFRSPLSPENGDQRATMSLV
jgi:hypothetical protein